VLIILLLLDKIDVSVLKVEIISDLSLRRRRHLLGGLYNRDMLFLYLFIFVVQFILSSPDSVASDLERYLKVVNAVAGGIVNDAAAPVDRLDGCITANPVRATTHSTSIGEGIVHDALIPFDLLESFFLLNGNSHSARVSLIDLMQTVLRHRRDILNDGPALLVFLSGRLNCRL
jgi:hypothetical protein